MPGFFSLQKYRADRVLGCASCGLSRTCLSPAMPASGRGKLPILFLAEAPGQEEDKQNTQLVGAAGAELRGGLAEIDIFLDDCRKYNAVNCRPPKNRVPTATEITACRKFVLQEIEKTKPKVIVPLGVTALKSLLEHRLRGSKIGALAAWQGLAIPDGDLQAWICPTFHPSFTMRMAHDPTVRLLWIEDLRQAVSLLSKPDRVPKNTLEHFKSTIRCLTIPERIATLLDTLLERKPTIIGIDFETTGLKPDAPGHDIFSCGLAVGNKGYAFSTRDPLVRSKLVKVLKCRQIAKAVWNLQFEQRWAKAIFGSWIQNIVWDGMLAAHTLDCRRGFCGLKKQVYLELGIIDYSHGIDSFFEAKGSNGINNIRRAPIGDLLLYNGLDALFTLIIAKRQRKKLEGLCFVNPH